MPPDVQPGGASDDRKWTVMVFMGADSLAGNSPLIDAAEADLAEMELVGSGDALNIFVQVHRGKDVVPRVTLPDLSLISIAAASSRPASRR
jgi:hypothetical protein